MANIKTKIVHEPLVDRTGNVEYNLKKSASGYSVEAKIRLVKVYHKTETAEIPADINSGKQYRKLDNG